MDQCVKKNKLENLSRIFVHSKSQKFDKSRTELVDIDEYKKTRKNSYQDSNQYFSDGDTTSEEDSDYFDYLDNDIIEHTRINVIEEK